MLQLNTLFASLVSWAAVSLIVLSLGALIAHLLRQPIERVRCIQWTMAALLIAVVIRQVDLPPSWSWAVLPPRQEVVVSTQPTAAGTLVAEPAPAPRRLASAPSMDPPAMAYELPAGPEATEVAASLAADSVQQLPATLWRAFQIACLAIAALGAVWFAALLVIGRLRLSRLLRHCQPADESLWASWPGRLEAEARGTRVLLSDVADAPLTFGVRQPVIILPRHLVNGASQESVRYCLAHEWAHIKNFDIVTWWILHAMQPLLWFQPLFWRLRRELRTAQDQLADHFAVARSADRAHYAELLVQLASHRGVAHSGLALPMADRKSSLFRRVEMLLANPFCLAQAARRRVVIATVAGMGLAAICLGVLRLERIDAAPVRAELASSAAKAMSLDANEAAESPSSTETGAPAENKPAAAQQQTDPQGSEQGGEELSYTGLVVNQDTKLPIPDAVVTVRRMILTSRERRILEETEHKTNLLGMYSFKIPPQQVAEKSLYIELDVEHPNYAWKKGFGYALSMIRKNERLGEKPFFSFIEMSPSDPIVGRIVGPDGKPLEGVRIQSYSKAGAEDFEDYGSFFRTKTDAQGKFQLNLVKGGPSVFWVVPDDFAPVQILSGIKRGDWGDIAVAEGVSISGKVLTATGQPVAKVWVNLEDEESQREIQMPVASSLNRSCETDADGGFSLGPMKPGKYRLVVAPYPRELKYYQPVRQPAEVNDVFIARYVEIGPQDANRPFTIQAVPHVEFQGQYLDSHGKPCSGHEVMVFGNVDGVWYHTQLRPDQNGKIVGKLPHGLSDAKMNAITNEHSSLQVRLQPGGELHADEIELGVIEDDIIGVEIIRYTAPIVQLKPVDEDGKLVQGCKVAGIYTDGKDETKLPVGGMRTNIFFEKQADGRFRTSQMIPNREVAFTATAEGYADAKDVVTLTEGEEKEVVLVLKKAQPVDKPDDNQAAGREE